MKNIIIMLLSFAIAIVGVGTLCASLVNGMQQKKINELEKRISILEEKFYNEN